MPGVTLSQEMQQAGRSEVEWVVCVDEWKHWMCDSASVGWLITGMNCKG